MAGYIQIPIISTAQKCGIQLNPRTLGRVEVQGYCPFCSGTKNHLFLNTESDQWYCQKCGAGGNSVTLYAKIFGVDNKTAFERLRQDKVVWFTSKKSKPKRTPNAALAPLGIRHDVYYDMLSMMTLSEGHRKNLLRRGLSDERIVANMYRSIPTDWRVRREIARTLAGTYPLEGVPGFFTRDGGWSLWGRPGILIPYLTPDGYIQGLQIRLDDTADGKYRWLASNPDYGYENGTAASSWVHVTGDVTRDTACITEGGLKGDVASFLRNDALFVCVPGAGNIEFLVDTLSALPNVKRLVGCYDRDQMQNENVSIAVEKMEHELRTRLGIRYEPFAWDQKYNGIDDYLLARRDAKRMTA